MDCTRRMSLQIIFSLAVLVSNSLSFQAAPKPRFHKFSHQLHGFFHGSLDVNFDGLRKIHSNVSIKNLVFDWLAVRTCALKIQHPCPALCPAQHLPDRPLYE